MENMQLVSWQEAIGAWIDGKQIYIVDEDGYEERILEYDLATEGNWQPTALNVDTFKRGQWYIPSCKLEKLKEEVILLNQQTKEFEKLAKIMPDLMKETSNNTKEEDIIGTTINIENLTFQNTVNVSEIIEVIKNLPTLADKTNGLK